MSAQKTLPDSDPRTPSEAPHGKRPWGWIVVAVLLATAVVGLAIYASNLDSDLDEANAKIASQQEQLDQAQKPGAGAAAAKAAFDDLSSQLGTAQANATQAVDEANARLDDAEQAAADAKGTADEAQAEIDAAQAKAETAASCAQSFLSAFSGVFSGASVQEGVEAAVADLQKLQPQCASALETGS
jgi:chromosome segregation ATPase